MPTDYSTEIAAAAQGPKSVSVDGTSVQAQDVDSIIKAEAHVAGKTSATKNHFGLRFRRGEPPGAGQ
jgi:hypothetical protein